MFVMQQEGEEIISNATKNHNRYDENSGYGFLLLYIIKASGNVYIHLLFCYTLVRKNSS